MLTANAALLSLALAFPQDAGQKEELQVLNYLTQALAGIYEGVPPVEIRTRLIARIRQDPDWTTASKMIEKGVLLCSKGESLKGVKAASTRKAAEAEGTQNLVFIGKVIGAAVSGGTLTGAIALLTSTSDRQVDHWRKLAKDADSDWGKTLALYSLDLARAKESIRKRTGSPQRAVLSLEDARSTLMTFRAITQPGAADTTEHRRQLLRQARATNCFPELFMQLGMLYRGTDDSRALRYFEQAVEQSGQYLREDSVAGIAALAATQLTLQHLPAEPSLRKIALAKAGAMATQARDYLPKSSVPILLEARCKLLATGDPSPLIAAAREALEIEGEHALARSLLFEALGKTDRQQEQIDCLKVIASKHPMQLARMLDEGTIDGSPSPTPLLAVATPEVKIEWITKGGRRVPLLKNEGSVPLAPSLLVIDAPVQPPLDHQWALQIPRLAPSETMDLDAMLTKEIKRRHESQRSPEEKYRESELGAEFRPEYRWVGATIAAYGSQGWLPLSIRLLRKPRSVLLPTCLAFPPVIVPKGKLRAIFQLVRTEDRNDLYVVILTPGTTTKMARLLLKSGQTTFHDVQRWVGKARSFRVPLSQAAVAHLSSRKAFQVTLELGDQQIAETIITDQQYRSFDLTFLRANLADADFKGNEAGAPELYAEINLNGKTFFHNRPACIQDSSAVQWAKDKSVTRLFVRTTDKLAIELWDEDAFEDDRLQSWLISWEEATRWKGQVKLQTPAGTSLIFEVRESFGSTHR